MRPISGIVLAGGVVRCENGLIIHGMTPPEAGVYDRVWVYYNFTKGEVARIVLQQCMGTDPATEEGIEEPRTDEMEDTPFWCSSTVF